MKAYRVAYDGEPFHGFQRQPDVPTVEDAILDALGDLDVLAGDADVPAGYAAAGRTDAGVSALAQTVGFAAPEWLTPAALNSELPRTVRAWAAADAPADFHATHDATERTYTYHLHAPDADDDRVRAALAALSGEHDFHNLTPDETGTVRDLTAEATRDGEFLVLRVSAGGFARQLVRRLVALVAGVGRGERDPAAIERVLAPAPLPGPAGVAPAPAAPLVLTDVTYPDRSFERDAEAAASARTVFAEKRLDHRTRARVAGEVADGLPDA
ncbi:MAG: tRNA pseudouridine(38-40) synthase TruA [Halorientalis sp.]